MPSSHEDFDIPLEAPATATKKVPGKPTPANMGLESSVGDSEFAMESPREDSVDYDSMNFEEEAIEELDDGGDDPFSKISELMMSNQPEAIPDVFAAPPPKPAPRRKGAAVLVFLTLIIVVICTGVGLYVGRNHILKQYPSLYKYYEKVGVTRDEVIGLGLEFRDYHSERITEDNNEVLIVRGVIENTTEHERDIPLMRLVLYNNKTPVQEKIVNPPQASLGPKETVGFSLTLEQPDASATNFEISFTAPKPVPKPDAQAPAAKP
jgi:hypothetical protein